jgi:hypothetical protein
MIPKNTRPRQALGADGLQPGARGEGRALLIPALSQPTGHSLAAHS